MTFEPCSMRCMELNSVHCDELGPLKVVGMGCDNVRDSAKLEIFVPLRLKKSTISLCLVRFDSFVEPVDPSLKCCGIH
jgi:hypothetical protein